MKKMNLPAALCAVVLAWLCTGAALAVENPFVDVSEENVYYDAVLWAYSNDVTKGTTADAFSPKSACNRGQVVTFLWRASGRPEPATKSNPFTDVSPDSYCYKAVLWAVEQGITNGTAPDKFSPQNPCTFAHVLVFLWRANGQPESASRTLVGGAWYSEAVAWANERGLLAELPLNPSEACPRACIVTYLYRNQTGQSVSVEDMRHWIAKSRILGATLDEAIEGEWDGEWLFLYFEHESDEGTVMSDICGTEILQTDFAGAVVEGWSDIWLTLYYYAFTDALANQGEGLSGAWMDEGVDGEHVSSLWVLQNGDAFAFRYDHRGGHTNLFTGRLEDGVIRYTDGVYIHRGMSEESGLSGEVRIEGESLYWAEDDGDEMRYYRAG